MTVSVHTERMVRDFVRQSGFALIPESQASLPPPLGELHRAVLRGFLDDGRPPNEEWLYGQAKTLGLDPRDAVAQLAAKDLVHVVDGRVAVAYPFSGTPTRHQVWLDGGPPVYAMCAGDALGIPLMAGRDGVITTTDPQTGDPIRVELRDGVWSWSPQSTVVLLAYQGGCTTAAEGACGSVNFHTSTEPAGAYLRDRPERDGPVLGQVTAVETAEMIFGPLLADVEREGGGSR